MSVFQDKVDEGYRFLEKMKPGDRIEITVIAKRDPETFLEICKAFIDVNPDFELSNDYKYIKRINPWPITILQTAKIQE